MAIVICSTQAKFFDSAVDWLDDHPEHQSNIVDFIASLKAFMINSLFSTLFLKSKNNILTFQRETFLEAFPLWKAECLEYHQQDQNSFRQSAKMYEVFETQVLSFINDDSFLIDQGLVVHDLLYPTLEVHHDDD